MSKSKDNKSLNNREITEKELAEILAKKYGWFDRFLSFINRSGRSIVGIMRGAEGLQGGDNVLKILALTVANSVFRAFDFLNLPVMWAVAKILGKDLKITMSSGLRTVYSAIGFSLSVVALALAAVPPVAFAMGIALASMAIADGLYLFGKECKARWDAGKERDSLIYQIHSTLDLMGELEPTHDVSEQEEKIKRLTEQLDAVNEKIKSFTLVNMGFRVLGLAVSSTLLANNLVRIPVVLFSLLISTSALALVNLVYNTAKWVKSKLNEPKDELELDKENVNEVTFNKSSKHMSVLGGRGPDPEALEKASNVTAAPKQKRAATEPRKEAEVADEPKKSFGP